MHTGPMKDSDGEFAQWHVHQEKHRDCGGVVRWREWESSCGGYVDYQYRCEKCGKRWWIDGPDS